MLKQDMLKQDISTKETSKVNRQAKDTIRRNTTQCALVYEAVGELRNHATADDVYEAVLKKNARISRGTVYRNLNRLAVMGKIRRLAMPDGADRFDHCCREHYHVQCEMCGRVCDVDMDCIGDLEERIRDRRGFEFTGHDIFFRGICPDCRRAGK